MSLPDFKPQMGLFGIYGALGLKLDSEDRYRLFAEKIYPLLVEARAEVEKCYCPDNGRPSVEPVLLLGVTLWQFVEKCCFSNYFVVNFLIKLSLADLWQIILMGKGRVPRPFRLSVCF